MGREWETERGWEKKKGLLTRCIEFPDWIHFIFAGGFFESHRGSRQSVQIMKAWTVQTVSVLALSAYRWNAEIYNTISFSSYHTGDPVWKDLRVTSSGGKRKCMSNHWSKKSSINFRFPSLFMPIFLKKWMDGKELIPMYIILNSYSFLFCGLV